MNSKASQHAFRLINKCLWKGGAEDMYKSSFINTMRSQRCVSVCNSRQLNSVAYSEKPSITRQKSPINPMLNGVTMLQWFFDEVRPDQREVRYWMKYFSQATNPSKPFAVIQISEDVFEQDLQDQVAKENGEITRTMLETLSLSLYFLQQNKMNVVILVGSDIQEETTATHKIVRERIHRNIQTLVDRLDESGACSTPVFDGGNIFNTDKDFRVESLNTGNLDWLAKHTSIPIIGCIGESYDGRLGLVQLDDGAHTLSAYTRPLKVLLLNATGGISDHLGQRLTMVFLPKESELHKFVNQPWWNQKVEDRFIKVCDILKILPKQSSYVITSAKDLLTELLTQRGVGTIFKKVVPVKKYMNLYDDVSIGHSQKKKLIDVLPGVVESAFGSSTSQAYWEELLADLQAVYVTDDLKSCAIVRNLSSLPGVAYLDKFAVSKEERGNFSIDVLWQQLKHDYDSLYWRSRSNNVFNNWYEARSDGVVKMGYYHIFWFGLGSADINAIVRQCESLPNSFCD